LKIYIGFKKNQNPKIFMSKTKPSKESHPEFDFIYGPFDSREKAQKYIRATGGLACGDG
jgi:hypothetical protein